MDHWKIEGDNYIIILLEHYLDYVESNEISCVSNFDFISMEHLVDYMISTNKSCFFLDMKYVRNAGDRVFAHLKDKEILKSLVFFNLQFAKKEVVQKLQEDLKEELEEDKNHHLIYFSEEVRKRYFDINFQTIYMMQKKEILLKYVTREITFLQSSGVYSNMSLDYKEMLEFSSDLHFLIGELSYFLYQIMDKKKIHSLVAASKNGIVLASIIGQKVGLPVIYHSNIGQKYVRKVLKGKTSKKTNLIEEENNYVLIYDVVCLGTEIRILNGIINAFGGNLVGGIGMVCVQESDKYRQKNKDSVLAKVQCFATAKELGLNYRIALTSEELKGDDC